MKCLFCGKDLPLLKRLSGAEFCSDEHRQQYQQEYSDLALSRLAQQKAAANKTAPPVKQQPAPESAGASQPSKDAPKASPSPSMKLAEAKPDARKPSRPVSEPKTSEPKVASAPPPKPALVTKTSRPAITPASVTPISPAPASGAAEASRPEPKKLSVTPMNTKPSRSVVPLQEGKPLRVTETKVGEAKVEPKTPAKVDGKIVEPARPVALQEPVRVSRPSAHAPLRLELPIGPASVRLTPERRLIPTQEVHRPEQTPEPATTKGIAEQAENAPISEARGEALPQTAFEQTAKFKAPPQAPHGEMPVIEEAAHKIEEAALKIEEAALKIEGAAVKPTGAVRKEIGETISSQPVSANPSQEAGSDVEAASQAQLGKHPVIEEAALKIEGAAVKDAGSVRRNMGDEFGAELADQTTPEVVAPAPLAGLEQSQPPSADWKAPVRVTGLHLAQSVAPALPRGGIRPRSAGLMGAHHLSSSDILTPSASPLRARPVRLEIREFARMEPVLEFKPRLDVPHIPAADQALALSFLARTLQAEPKLWAEPAREFGIGLDPAEQTAFLETLAASFDVWRDTAPTEQSSREIGELEPRLVVNGKAGASGIDLSREPRPVTLGKSLAPEGMPGGKAKPVQMFTSTLRESAQAAVPFYDALPLRATIVVGPANGSLRSGGGSAE